MARLREHQPRQPGDHQRQLGQMVPGHQLYRGQEYLDQTGGYEDLPPCSISAVASVVADTPAIKRQQRRD